MEKKLYICTSETIKIASIMKKLVIALSIFTLALSLSSCDYLERLGAMVAKGGIAEPVGQNIGATTNVTNPNEVRIYSNAYDGFVNVRAQPSTKSAILGRLKNGQDYLVQLGVQGKWKIVQWHDTIGYVNSSVVGYTPWKPVYIDTSAISMQGVVDDGDYGENDWVHYIFNNGKWAFVFGGDLELAGTWKLEGYDIIFTVKYYHDESSHWFLDGELLGGQKVDWLPLKRTLGSHFRGYAFKNACREGSFTYTFFQDIRKETNKLVRLQ